MQDTEVFLSAALRGENPAWPAVGDAAFTARFLERSTYHGVQPLLHHLLKSQQVNAQGWPREVLEEFHRVAIGQAMWELRHQALLKQVLEHLAALGVQPVLFKGTALAYDLYPSPVLRSRGDTDLIVAIHDRERVAEALQRLGFKRESSVSGNYLSYQESFTYTEVSGTAHCLDLHWRINNSQLLAKLFSYEELRAQALALTALSPHAKGAGAVHALLLACMHRSTHKQAPYYVDGVAHYSGDRLIWLYDIHLLAEKLTRAEQEEFISLANQKGLKAVCLEGLTLAQNYFGTHIAKAVIRALTQPGPPEPVAHYMESATVRRLWLDLCAIDGLQGKLGFLYENLFPSTNYMREKYPDSSATPLPWLYLRRMTGGVMKLLKRNQA